MFTQSLQIKFQERMVIFQTTRAVISQKSMGIIDTNSDEIIRTCNLLKSSFSKGVDEIHQWSQKSN